VALTKQERQVKELGLEAQEFLKSKLGQATQAELLRQLREAYPTPNKRGWEDKYRYAKAYEKASEDIVNFWIGLRSQFEMLCKQEKDGVKDINEA
jgi:hypothetical protein